MRVPKSSIQNSILIMLCHFQPLEIFKNLVYYQPIVTFAQDFIAISLIDHSMIMLHNFLPLSTFYNFVTLRTFRAIFKRFPNLPLYFLKFQSYNPSWSPGNNAAQFASNIVSLSTFPNLRAGIKKNLLLMTPIAQFQSPAYYWLHNNKTVIIPLRSFRKLKAYFNHYVGDITWNLK